MRSKTGLVFWSAMVLSSVALAQGVHQHGATSPPNISSEHSTHKGFDAEMRAAMEHMHAAMAAAPTTANPDRDFLGAMIPHHQGAIEMAKAVLLVTQDPGIRNLAQSIITDQQYEIELMKTLLSKPAANATPYTEKEQ